MYRRLKGFESNFRRGVTIEADSSKLELIITYKEITTYLSFVVHPMHNKWYVGNRKHPRQLIEEINNILDSIDQQMKE